MADAELFLALSAGHPAVIKVGGKCYSRVGESHNAPNTSSFDEAFGDCGACIPCPESINGARTIAVTITNLTRWSSPDNDPYLGGNTYTFYNDGTGTYWAPAKPDSGYRVVRNDGWSNLVGIVAPFCPDGTLNLNIALVRSDGAIGDGVYGSLDTSPPTEDCTCGLVNGTMILYGWFGGLPVGMATVVSSM
jgi:hypothetical protein